MLKVKSQSLKQCSMSGLHFVKTACNLHFVILQTFCGLYTPFFTCSLFFLQSFVCNVSMPVNVSPCAVCIFCFCLQCIFYILPFFVSSQHFVFIWQESVLCILSSPSGSLLFPFFACSRQLVFCILCLSDCNVDD